MNGTETVMTRVQLPYHLRTLAGVHSEIVLEDAATLDQVVDALEAAYPGLRGTVRDAATGKRRAFVRFFACKQDLSHASPGDPLPEAVLRGDEPLLVVGAMAGG